MSEILYGKPVAESMTSELLRRAEKIRCNGIVPTLATIRLGCEKSQIAFERSTSFRCAAAGVRTKHIVLDSLITENELLEVIEQINRDASIHGCLILLPLPEHIDARKVCDRLDFRKDVDALSSESLSRVFIGKESFYPCAAQACIDLLDYYDYEISGKNICVIGRSLVVGKPVSMLCLSRNATVTICHTATQKLSEIASHSDILITAAGCVDLVTSEFINPGQIILDVGVTADAEGKLHGDVDFASVSDSVAAMSPIPGGIGIVASTVIAKHTLEAAEYYWRNGKY